LEIFFDVPGKLVLVPDHSVLGSWARELNRWLHEPEVVIVNAATPAKRHDQIVQGVKDNAWRPER
jgi:hypothetical protein